MKYYDISTKIGRYVNLQNVLQKNITKWKYSKKFRGGATFLKHLLYYSSGIFRGGNGATASILPLVWPWIFWIIFALYLLASFCNRKIRVARPLVTVHVFRLLKAAGGKMDPNLTILGTKNDFCGGAAPPPHPLLSTPMAPRLLLTKILNTPLYFSTTYR